MVAITCVPVPVPVRIMDRSSSTVTFGKTVVSICAWLATRASLPPCGARVVTPNRPIDLLHTICFGASLVVRGAAVGPKIRTALLLG
ncbi:hypothetical protein RE0356_17770 [Prescottella equi]|nr:hypothetical protein RE0356_17770 [Prescottella equi]